MRFDVVTLFPGMFRGFLAEGLLRIAREKGAVDVAVHDLRDYTLDKHRKVDARPYGGGPGMVIAPEPVFRAVEALRARGREKARLILLTPQGPALTQRKTEDLARARDGLILVCGHYEGFDERVVTGLEPEPLSVGDYVLSGGEPAAMVVLDAVTRLLPGVLGRRASLDEESFGRGLLEYPQYTRPPEFRGLRVPEVLLSGDHRKIREWREERALERTRALRPDLYRKHRAATRRKP